MPAKNITSRKFYTDRFETIDPQYEYTCEYHKNVPSQFQTLPTFVAEFNDCRVNTCPVLITRDNEIISDHVWPLRHTSKHKPQKTHGLWTKWEDSVDIMLPRPTEYFNESYVYVWLPVDEYCVGNPWHIWIDVISKFRLMEKRWSTNFSRYCFILANESPYLQKVCEALFPDVKIVVMPKGETWQFKHLMVPSLSNHDDGVTVPALPAWLRHFKGLPKLKGVKPHRKTVVLRPGANSRRLLNSDELLLKLKGWDTVNLEHMSIVDQMKTFAESTHILAAHGAGLTNLLWCSAGTKVIEIQDKNMLHKKVYPVLSQHLGLEHKLYVAESVQIPLQQGKRPKGIKRFSDMIDFKINIPDILEVLE